MKAQDIAQAVADNAKTGKWLSASFALEHPRAIGGTLTVGIKAFGKWVQIVQIGPMKDGVPEQKTLKALKQKTAELIEALAVQTAGPLEAEEAPDYRELAFNEGFEILDTPDGYRWAAKFFVQDSLGEFDTLQEAWEDIKSHFPAIGE